MLIESSSSSKTKLLDERQLKIPTEAEAEDFNSNVSNFNDFSTRVLSENNFFANKIRREKLKLIEEEENWKIFFVEL